MPWEPHTVTMSDTSSLDRFQAASRREIQAIRQQRRTIRERIHGTGNRDRSVARLRRAKPHFELNLGRIVGRQDRIIALMADVTQVLSEIEHGDPNASEQLLPLVYEELRKLAAQRLAKEAPGQTLQATALVHEAFVRLVDVEHRQKWNSRGHFFAAAAEAMRRILVENSRRKHSLKRGGDVERQHLAASEIVAPDFKHDVLVLNEALERLNETDQQAATLVKLRYFTGLTVEETAQAMELSIRSTERLWTWAKAWLYSNLRQD